MPPEIIKTELALSLVTLAVFGILLAADLLNRHAAKKAAQKRLSAIAKEHVKKYGNSFTVPRRML